MTPIDISAFAISCGLNILLIKVLWKTKYWRCRYCLTLLQIIPLIETPLIVLYWFPHIYRMLWFPLDMLNILINLVCFRLCIEQSERLRLFGCILLYQAIVRLVSYSPFDLFAQFVPTAPYWLSVILSPITTLLFISAIYEEQYAYRTYREASS